MMQRFRTVPLILWLFPLFLLAAPMVVPTPIHSADATSFDPTKVAVKAKGAGVPVGTIVAWSVSLNPEDMENWLECNGQSFSSAAYPELFALVGGHVPDLRGQFLRGLQAGHSVGQRVAHSIASHNHTQPTHTHSFSGQLASTAISGTAAGQQFSTNANLNVSGTAAGQRVGIPDHTHGIAYYNSGLGYVSGGFSIQPSGTSSSGMQSTGGTATTVTASSSSISGSAAGTVSGTASSSSVTGRLTSGAVTGTIGYGGGDATHYTGGAETAPDHVYVRYFIRARP